MVQLCRSSAERIASWRDSGRTTRDFGYSATLHGADSAALIRRVLEYGGDREFLRRELTPVIDLIQQAGFREIVSELRIRLRDA